MLVYKIQKKNSYHCCKHTLVMFRVAQDSFEELDTILFNDGLLCVVAISAVFIGVDNNPFGL